MAKRRKAKYYAYQTGGNTNFNWSIPENDTPSVVNQTATGATDTYGNTYFKQDNTGDPTTNNPDVVPIGSKKSFLDSIHTKGDLNPAIQNLNTVMQGVTGVANMVNEVKNRKDEKDQQLRAITPKYYENMEGYGLNANPVFTQYGGSAKYQLGGRPTTSDSLALYNNSKEVAKYYNNKNYKTQYFSQKGDSGIDSFNYNNEQAHEKIKAVGYNTHLDNKGGSTTIKPEQYHKDVDSNKYYQRDNQNSILDINSPMTLFDKRIKPNFLKQVENTNSNSPLVGDVVELYGYDPIAVKPWNMLTPEEREIRVKKYGTPEQRAEMKAAELPPERDFKPSIVSDSEGWHNHGKLGRARYLAHRDENDPNSMNTLQIGKSYDINIPEPGYKPTNVSQPTKYSATYRDTSDASKQHSIYFPDRNAWQGFVNSGALGNIDTSETSDSASATGYRRMQTGGNTENDYQMNAQLVYYKGLLNDKLKAKNPQAYSDYFKGLRDLRMKGDQTAVDNYIQNTPYNEYLSPDEVKSTLGDLDYATYSAYLNAKKPKLAGQIEGQQDYGSLNYGRRFASLPFATSYSQTNTTSGRNYSRDYTYNPKTGLPEWTETGDINLRPQGFSSTQAQPVTAQEEAEMMKKLEVMKKENEQFKKQGLLKKNGGYGQYKNGGGVPKTYGLQEGGRALANVEAEQGEAFQTNDGQIAQIPNDANTHEQGGVFLPNVHRVLENTSNIRKDKTSKLLKLTSEDVEATTGAKVKGSMSHAEALVKANDYFEDKRNKITKKIEMSAKDRPELDKYSELSTKLNVQHFHALPTQEQLFEQLFNRQEAVKAQYGIPTGGQAKYGGGLDRSNDYGSKSKPYPSVNSGDFAGGGRSYPIPTRADAEDALRLAHLHGRSDVVAKVYEKYPDLKKAQLGGYTGNKSGKKTPAGHSDAFSGSFDDYLKELTSKGFKYEGIGSNAELQKALYDYKLQHGELDDLRKMWGEGMHQTGMAQAKKLGFVDDKGNFKPGVLDSEENLKKLADLYPDNMLGPRILRVNKGKTPPRIWSDDAIPQEETPQVAQNLDTSIIPVNIKQQPRSKFYEPLRWYDTASATNAYLAALEREPGKYNPMEFNQLRYKLQDPTAALQQNQADFNAGTQAVQDMSANNPGGAAANIANLAAQKYAANNQVLGAYENQNAQIKNNEITYNTQVRDKNSAADQQAREVFENKVLTSKAIQQEQKLTALDSLYKTIAENKALNRNGNLVMKTARAFDQYGEYNGYQPIFSVNPAFGINNNPAYNITKGKSEAAGGIQKIGPNTFYNRKTGKNLYFDGTKLVER